MKLKDQVKALVALVLSSLLLVSCSGTNVYVTGNNNTITAEQLREGGGTVDTKPITSWGNVK
jgi:hypothetical protein